ncbi:MAG: hypothetical protein ACRD3W_18185, partial [Terriglobales bacterium]
MPSEELMQASLSSHVLFGGIEDKNSPLTVIQHLKNIEKLPDMYKLRTSKERPSFPEFVPSLRLLKPLADQRRPEFSGQITMDKPSDDPLLKGGRPEVDSLSPAKPRSLEGFAEVKNRPADENTDLIGQKPVNDRPPAKDRLTLDGAVQERRAPEGSFVSLVPRPDAVPETVGELPDDHPSIKKQKPELDDQLKKDLPNSEEVQIHSKRNEPEWQAPRRKTKSFVNSRPDPDEPNENVGFRNIGTEPERAEASSKKKRPNEETTITLKRPDDTEIVPTKSANEPAPKKHRPSDIEQVAALPAPSPEQAVPKVLHEKEPDASELLSGKLHARKKEAVRLAEPLVAAGRRLEESRQASKISVKDRAQVQTDARLMSRPRTESPESRFLSWDEWYAAVAKLSKPLLMDAEEQHGNPAGENRLSVTVT